MGQRRTVVLQNQLLRNTVPVTAGITTNGIGIKNSSIWSCLAAEKIRQPIKSSSRIRQPEACNPVTGTRGHVLVL